MINRFITFVFILIANFAFSQNQEAIILFNDGSTIEGFGSINKNKIYFRASLDDKSDSWSYDMVKGITFLGFESTIKYEYVLLDEFSHPEPQLIEVVEEGNVTLYARIRETFQTSGFNLNGFNVNSTRTLTNTIVSNLNANENVTTYIFDKRTNEKYPFVTNTIVSYRSGRDNVTIDIFVKRTNEKYPLSLNSSFFKRAVKYFSDCVVLTKKIDKGEFSKNKILEIVQYYNDICAE